MKIEKYDGAEERRILIAMIVNRTVVGRLSSIWTPGFKPFSADLPNAVGRMCVDHFARFGDAPKKDIVHRMARWHEKRGGKEDKSLMDSLVESLSNEYERSAEDVNAEVVIEAAQEVFSKNSLRKLAGDLQAVLDAGDVQKAEEIRQAYARIELGAKEGAFLEDKELWQAAFAEPDESLINYGQGLAEFFGRVLNRDCFFSFMGAEKRGKTWWLTDLAWRAMRQGLRVAYFQAGDQSRNQIMRRIAVRAAKHPRWPCTIEIPKGIEFKPEDGRAYATDVEVKKFDKNLDWKKGYQGYLTTLEKTKQAKGEKFWLSCFDASTLSVEEMRSILQFRSQSEGWHPDVVVIDYADIIAPSPAARKLDERAQIKATWVEMKRLSTQMHCLVVTATQVKAEAYKADLLTMSHFSEDKRKFSHVDGMIGINMDGEEKPRSAYRLNWVALRDQEYDPFRPVYCLGCLAIGNPAIKSIYPKRTAKE
jgi:hypothetical protein